MSRTVTPGANDGRTLAEPQTPPTCTSAVPLAVGSGAAGNRDARAGIERWCWSARTPACVDSLRWGEAAGLTRTSVDYVRSRINITTTAVEVGGTVSLGQQPKTMRSRRTVPVARAVMRRIESHLAAHVPAAPEALVFTASKGGPLFRGTFVCGGPR